MQNLTTSQLQYLRCIRLLAETGTVRATDISRQIGFSMPSVHHMLVTLEALGMITKSRYMIALTEEGRNTLAYYDRALTAAEAFLTRLGLTDCTDDAMALITCLSASAVERLIDCM